MTSLELREGVGLVTINNEAVRNALDDVTRQALLAAMKETVSDPDCKAVLLTGAGRTFCAGGDLSSMPTDEPAIRQRLGEMHEIVRLIHAGPKPVVAAVDGVAFGSGFSLAAASDHVVATSEAMFGCSFGRVGLVADSGLVWTLAQRVGVRAARRILLEGRTIDAEEGVHLGLIDEMATPSELIARALEWASAFSRSAPKAVAATKRLLASPGPTLDDLLASELDAQVHLLASDDFAEGRRAFFERRPPIFGNQGGS